MTNKENDIDLVTELGRENGVEVQSWEQLREALAVQINQLINNNFDELIRMLYRVDVSENKLKFLLKEKVGEDAAFIIADLVIERQLQKIRSRNAFQQPPPDESFDETW